MPEPIETERLILREYTLDDAEDAFQIYRDPDVVHFLSSKQQESIESQRETLRLNIERYRQMGEEWLYRAMQLRSTGRVIGTAMLKPLPDHEMIEVGWHLAKDCWGQGFATEAGRACVEYGFQKLNLERIVAVINPLNSRSGGVAKRLGMTYLGQITAYNQQVDLYELMRPA